MSNGGLVDNRRRHYDDDDDDDDDDDNVIIKAEARVGSIGHSKDLAPSTWASSRGCLADERDADVVPARLLWRQHNGRAAGVRLRLHFHTGRALRPIRWC